MASFINSSPVANAVSFTRNIFSGKGIGQSPVALLPQQAPQTESNALQRNVVSQEQVQLNSISTQLNVFSKQLIDINSSLQTISKLITEDSSLEVNEQKRKESEQFQLIQDAERSGKENVVERKTQSLLSKPLESIQKRFTSVFSKITGIFGTLFFGWLTNQGIAAFQANAEGATSKLEEIKNNVLSAFGFIYNIFRLFNTGIGIIVDTIKSAIGKITGFLLNDVIGNLFRKLGDIGKALVQGAQNLLPKATPPSAPASTGDAATKATTEAADTATAKLTQEATETAGKATTKTATEVAERRGGNILSRLIPGAGTLLNLGAAGYRFLAGDPLGGALSLGSAIPGPVGVGFVGLDIARDLGAWGNKEESKANAATPTATAMPTPRNITTPQSNNTVNPQQLLPKPSQTTTSPQANTTSVEPKVKLTPQETSISTPSGTITAAFNSSLNFNNYGSTIVSGASTMSQQQTMDFSKPAMFGEITGNVVSLSNATTGQMQTPMISMPVSKIEPTTRPQNVRPLPEPKPNIIVAPLPQQNQQAKASPKQSVSGSGTKVPTISPVNPDNFYAMYSQISYNVVV